MFTQPDLDGHNDLAIVIRYLYNNRIYDPAFTKPFETGGLKMHVDLPRLKTGKLGGAFWSAFVPCPANGLNFSDEAYSQSKPLEISFSYWPSHTKQAVLVKTIH